MYYLRLIEENNAELIYYCRNCGHEKQCNEKQSVLVSKKNIKNKTISLEHFINEYTKLDPTIPRIYTIKCIETSCPSNLDLDDKNKVDRDILYIKYDRENLKYLYMCCHCDTIWDNEMKHIKV